MGGPEAFWGRLLPASPHQAVRPPVDACGILHSAPGSRNLPQLFGRFTGLNINDDAAWNVVSWMQLSVLVVECDVLVREEHEMKLKVVGC